MAEAGEASPQILTGEALLPQAAEAAALQAQLAYHNRNGKRPFFLLRLKNQLQSTAAGTELQEMAPTSE
ncbi:unnamed protein product [Urochloa humidicola]